MTLAAQLQVTELERAVNEAAAISHTFPHWGTNTSLLKLENAQPGSSVS